MDPVTGSTENIPYPSESRPVEKKSKRNFKLAGASKSKIMMMSDPKSKMIVAMIQKAWILFNEEETREESQSSSSLLPNTPIPPSNDDVLYQGLLPWYNVIIL